MSVYIAQPYADMSVVHKRHPKKLPFVAPTAAHLHRKGTERGQKVAEGPHSETAEALTLTDRRVKTAALPPSVRRCTLAYLCCDQRLF